MENSSDQTSGAEEFVSVEIELAEQLAPGAEKAVREALDKVENGAIDSLNLDERKISVCYDPTRISREQLTKLISQAGAKPKRDPNQSGAASLTTPASVSALVVLGATSQSAIFSLRSARGKHSSHSLAETEAQRHQPDHLLVQ